MKEKVSIIIPVYQSEHSIERCVLSLVKGSYENLQIILVEDCSKDNSWLKCEQLALKYEQVEAIRNDKNHGVSYTRNQGLKIADGKYLMFVDSDDWVESDYVENLVSVQEKFHPVFSLCGYYNHDEFHGGKDEVFGFEKDGEIQICHSLENLYTKRQIQVLWNKVFDLNLIKENGIKFDETISIGEDFRLILEYLDLHDAKEMIYLINRPLYHYMRDNSNSLMSAPELTNIEELLKNKAHMQRILGIDEDTIENNIEQERIHQFDVYGYIICHSEKYSEKEKKEVLEKVVGNRWKQIYIKNRKLQMKEKIYHILKR